MSARRPRTYISHRADGSPVRVTVPDSDRLPEATVTRLRLIRTRLESKDSLSREEADTLRDIRELLRLWGG